MQHCSMTGFGSASADCAVGRLCVEIKSVNSRFFEFNPRLPDDFRWAESLCREKIQAHVQRGKVDFRLSLTRNDQSLSQTKINPAGLASALRLAHEIRTDHPEIAQFSVSDLLRLPGVTQESQLSQEEWTLQIRALLDQALVQFSESRAAEGQRLVATIAVKLGEISALADKAQRFLPVAIEAQQAKLAERLKEALSAAIGSGAPALSAEQLAALDDRVRQEAAVFGLRIDIAEELDRLRSHIEAARKTGSGKRLDFLAQEMNREANTLGSKAASSELSTLSIEMKLLIEQIREQAQNLE
jgi:uncharacterized protein (TIGR00255 family)